MAVDALASFLTHRKIKRVLALLIFIVAAVLLRHLATLVIFYLIFSSGLDFASRRMDRMLPIGPRLWLAIVLLIVLGGIGVGAGFGVHRSLPMVSRLVASAREGASNMQNIKEHDVYKMLEAAHVDPKKYAKQIEHFGKRVLHGLRSTGRALMHLLIGLILGVLFVIERKDIEVLISHVPRYSLLGYLIAYFSYGAEAIVLTVKVQLIVALVNAVVTLPVILALGLHHAAALMLMVFVFGLVPVVGNFISGAVLAVLSYLQKGWWGVGIFLVSTFVLHKVESYYLNPRLVAKHVKLPSLVLIASLVVWEHLIGLAGIFVSFPVLYVTQRIRDQFREEALADAAALTNAAADDDDESDETNAATAAGASGGGDGLAGGAGDDVGSASVEGSDDGGDVAGDAK